MTLASDPLVADIKQSRTICSCVRACTGYDSRSNCPPLIVFAVLVNCPVPAPIFSDASEEMR
jgi:hypothetical protein